MNNDEKWKMSVNYEVPKWAQGEMMYQIFPDRFNRGNDYELRKENTLKRIDMNAFNKTGLSEVILPDGVEELGNFAFQKMDSLTKIYVPGTITTMGEFSFGNNPNLTDVVLGEGLQKIGASMFENCTSLKSINLPSTLLTIELGGFYNSGLESIDIPNIS